MILPAFIYYLCCYGLHEVALDCGIWNVLHNHIYTDKLGHITEEVEIWDQTSTIMFVFLKFDKWKQVFIFNI